MTISKAALTVTADDQSRAYGAANPALTATITGFKNGEILATSGVTGSPSLLDHDDGHERPVGTQARSLATAGPSPRRTTTSRRSWPAT